MAVPQGSMKMKSNNRMEGPFSPLRTSGCSPRKDLLRVAMWQQEHGVAEVERAIPITISDRRTWPTRVSDFLDANLSSFEGWECTCCKASSVSKYDSLVVDFRKMLREYSLVGYHCTRLTSEEIEEIRTNGMLLQNAGSLSARIERLQQNHLLSRENAERLRARNQADASNRRNMLWFCFFEPFLAGEHGIARLFRSWGGEALYNSHEKDAVTGRVLRSIGKPCIVKANVPISSLQKSFLPDGAMVRVLLEDLGHKLRIPVRHEGFSIQNIPAKEILEVFEYPSKEFTELSQCDTWSQKII